jgi:hypothetical protein
MAKHTAKKPDAFEMFCFANAYYEAAAILMLCHGWSFEKDGKHMIQLSAGPGAKDIELNPNAAIISSSVLLILSLEVFLKCLIRVRGRMPLREHDVSKLFAMLSAKDQRSIKRIFLAFPGYYEGTKRMGIESALAAASSFFVRMRYGYEIAHGARMPLLTVTPASKNRGTAGFCDVALATRSLILAKYPDWVRRYSARRVFH